MINSNELRQRKRPALSALGAPDSQEEPTATTSSTQQENQKKDNSQVLVDTLSVQFQQAHETSARTLYFIVWAVSLSSLVVVAYIDQAVLNQHDFYAMVLGDNDTDRPIHSVSERTFLRKLALWTARYLADPSRFWLLIHAAVLAPWLQFASLPLARFTHPTLQTQNQKSLNSNGYLFSAPFLTPLLANLSMAVWGVVLLDRETNLVVDVLWRLVHVGLLIGNACTIFFALLLKVDAQNAQELLQNAHATGQKLEEQNSLLAAEAMATNQKTSAVPKEGGSTAETPTQPQNVKKTN